MSSLTSDQATHQLATSGQWMPRKAKDRPADGMALGQGLAWGNAWAEPDLPPVTQDHEPPWVTVYRVPGTVFSCYGPPGSNPGGHTMLMKSTRRKAMNRSALGMAASLTLASGQAVALDGKTYSPNSVQIFVPNMKGQMTIVEVWYVAATSTSSDNNINTSIVYPSDNSVFISFFKSRL
jgi:hypothetical protein